MFANGLRERTPQSVLGALKAVTAAASCVLQYKSLLNVPLSLKGLFCQKQVGLV